MFQIKGKLKGSTLSELMVALVVSGIILLSIFEGIDILRSSFYVFPEKMTEGSNMLAGHRYIEALMETSDSILKKGENLYFYHVQGLVDTLIVSEGIYLKGENVNKRILSKVDSVWYIFEDNGSLHYVDSIYIMINRNKYSILSYGRINFQRISVSCQD